MGDYIIAPVLDSESKADFFVIFPNTHLKNIYSGEHSSVTFLYFH